MTREEREDAIIFFEEVAKKDAIYAHYSKLAIEALQQEPVLDKIRADVINIADDKQSIKVRSVLRIIDKHKAESEVKNESLHDESNG